MKLLMISTDRKIFEKGSPVALRQIEYAKNYEEVHIIVFALRSSQEVSEISLAPNIWVYSTRSSSRWMYIFDALKLGRFITEKRGIADVTCQDPFETGLVATLIKARHPMKLELQVHTDIGSPYFQKFTKLNRIRTIISKYTLPRADRIRVVSKRIRDYVARFTDPSKIEVRPIVVDENKIKNSSIIEENDLRKKYPQFEKIILMASRLEPEKNITLALEAFKIVLGKIPKAGLVIVGEGGEEKKLKDLACELGIYKNDNLVQNAVVFEKWQDDLVSYYKTCDCFLVTSLYEGYGMTLKEAQIAGTSIVSTDVGIAREVGAKVAKWDKEGVSERVIEIVL